MDAAAQSPVRVARVMMPEKGQYSIRCAEGFAAGRGVRVVVNLDYGIDIAELRDVGAYDPERDGPHPPGFTLQRLATPEDIIADAANESRARVLRDAFRDAAKKIVPDIRVPYARLSLGGTRLFVRYVCERQRPDFRHVVADMRKRHGVTVSAWQMGLRDEVRVMGALGPCGRACCCATWQQKYPGGISPETFKGQNPIALNGACGRFKCCLAFEREG